MSSLVVGLGLYGAGVAASSSPCVLPLIPGWLAVVADAQRGLNRWPRVGAFCAGAVATFALLGSVVAGLGSVAATADGLQRVAGAALIVAAVAAEAGRRGRWAATWHRAPPLPRSPLPRAAVLGIACGAAWTPCAGPLLGAALTVAGSGGSPLRAAALLAMFGAGVVTPLVALSLLPAPRMPQWWRRAGSYVHRVVPIVLAALGLLLLTGRYVPFVQRLSSAT